MIANCFQKIQKIDSSAESVPILSMGFLDGGFNAFFYVNPYLGNIPI